MLSTTTSTNKYIGGLSGYFKFGSISSSYNVGSVSSTLTGLTTMGGIAGVSGPTVTHAFFLLGSVGVNNGVGTGLAASSLKSATTISTLNNGGSSWKADALLHNHGFPVLSWQP